MSVVVSRLEDDEVKRLAEKPVLEDFSENAVGHRLWSSIYRPSSYLDLLTEETFNRMVLKWMKSFLDLVSTTATPAAPGLQPNQKPSFTQTLTLPPAERRTSGSTRGPNGEDLPLPRGGDRAPVLLIVGPPGVGKTTAVHIIARQAGFHVIEVNASDDRTRESVESMLRSVAGFDTGLMHQTFRAPCVEGRKTPSKARPALLLLDEIEGCDPLAIQALVRMIDAKDRHQQPVLKRPVVCCCNDLYARSLRVLRQKAKVVVVERTSEAKLVKRLTKICSLEHLPVDTEFLARLVELTEGDIRASLNVLELLSRVQLKTPSGRSPPWTSRTLQDLWGLMFRDKETREMELVQNTLHKATHRGQHGISSGHRQPRFSHSLEAVLEGLVDSDSMLLTLQDNLCRVRCNVFLVSKTFVQAPMYDPNGDKIAGFSVDTLRFHAASSVFCVLLYTHLFCASEGGQADTKGLIPYPLTLGYQAQQINQKRGRVVQQVLDGVFPQLRPSVASRLFPIDIGFYLVVMCTPALLFRRENAMPWKRYHALRVRPVAGQPFGGNLRDPLNRFHHMLELLLTFNLTFAKASTLDIALLRPSRQRRRLTFEERRAAETTFFLDPALHIVIEPAFSGYLSLQASATTRYQPLPSSTTPEACVAEGGNLWSPTVTFLAVNQQFDGYDYVTLQLTRVHGDLMREEIESWLTTGASYQQRVSQQTPLRHRSTLQSSQRPDDAQDGGRSTTASRQERLGELPLLFPPGVLAQYIRSQQQRRSDYERLTWRPSDTNERQHYNRLFDADTKSHKYFIFKYESGDAKAVRFKPSLLDLFDPAVVR